MLKIVIICVGKIKEKYFKEAILEYSKRLSKYSNIEIIELADEKAPENLKPAEEDIVRQIEGQRILNVLKDKTGIFIALDIKGKKMDSIGFSKFFSDNMVNGTSSFYFIIGGSLGLSKDVIKKANVLISFSDMTFPHQLMRVILIEQIYRANKIIKNEPYHK